MAIFKNFYINLDENMTISAYTGSSDINQSSNLAQYFGVKLKDWALEEGCFLYITFEREHNGVTFKVEPILMPYNMEFEACTIIVPPEVIALAGNWTYSIEKRNYAYLSTYDADDITDDTPYSSLTTAKAILTIKQSVVRSRDDNMAITEVELRTLVASLDNNKAAIEDLIDEATTTFEGLIEQAQAIVKLTECIENSESGSITYTMVDERDVSFTGELTRLALVIPKGIFHGFHFGANFNVSENGTEFVVTNPHTSKRLILMKRGHAVESYNLAPGAYVTATIICEGQCVLCNIVEV